MFRFLIAFTATVGILLSVAQAELLTENLESPYQVLNKASEIERQKFVQNFEEWIQGGDFTEAEVRAKKALISDAPEVSGPEVLEVLDAGLLAWFYGYEQDEWAGLRHRVARVTRNADIERCMTYQLCVVVSKAKQRIYAYENGSPLHGVHNQKVSTARAGKITPTGFFTVEELAGKNRYSGRYKGAYLGYAMQIHGHIFLHATSTDQYHKLGSIASAGCIRLHYDVAKQLNARMKQLGRSNIRVVVTDM